MSAARPFEDAPTTQIGNLPRLSHTQRSQLVKSTRKLAKILGENPMPQVYRSSVISPPWKKSQESNKVGSGSPFLSMAKKFARAALDPLQIVHRRGPDTKNEDIYDSKSSPGEMNALPRGNNWPSMLVLQAVTSRESESASDGHDDPYISSQVPSPAVSSFSKRPPSVISASASKSTLLLPAEWEKSKEEREISYRRKRVSKLARHLGERIPPDLMLPKPMSVKPSRRSQRRMRFSRARTPPVPSIVPPLPAESPTSEPESTLSLTSSSSMFDVSRPAVEETVEDFGSGSVPRPQFSRKHQRLHGTFSAPLLRERPTQPPTNGFSGGIGQSDANFLEDKELESVSSVVSPRRPESRLAFPHLRPASPSQAPNVYLHRSERRQGWSGEWNVGSMQDVISKLRDL